MELFSIPWWSALLAIILIDLVLAGDNAIVIALAARKLPPDLQKKAILWGTVGAIAVRSLMTFTVVWLLQIPGLMLAGGLGLLWIAYKLISNEEGEQHDAVGAITFWGAMKTIVVADALMGVDNVLGVAGAAHGSFDLVIIGLLAAMAIAESFGWRYHVATTALALAQNRCRAAGGARRSAPRPRASGPPPSGTPAR